MTTSTAPRLPDCARITVRLTAQQLAGVRALARERERSLGGTIRVAVNEHLHNEQRPHGAGAGADSSTASQEEAHGES